MLEPTNLTEQKNHRLALATDVKELVGRAIRVLGKSKGVRARNRSAEHIAVVGCAG